MTSQMHHGSLKMFFFVKLDLKFKFDKSGSSSAEHGNQHNHSSAMHPNYSPSAETHSSLSPNSPPPPSAAAANTNEDAAKEDTDSGFTLMHPAFQRHAPKRSHEPSANPSIYGQLNNLPGDQHHQIHASAQDLTTTVNCSGSFVGHSETGIMPQVRRSPSSTPDGSPCRELDLTHRHRAKQIEEKIINNNTTC